MAEPLILLCVDDEPQILSSLQRFCRNNGFLMHAATSASDALDLLKKQTVSVILSDFQMPQMNGLDFLRIVKTLHPHIPGIILSGYADLPVVSQALGNGEIFGFVAKPWDRGELATLIAAAARRSRQAPAKE
ncbi:MAG: response regulator [Pelovirga sp.]